MTHKTARLHRSREGFLLVTVIVMIAIASVLLVRLAAKSSRVALTAVEEERDMRHRWAAMSLRRYSLSAAPGLLGSQRRSPNLTKPILWRNIQLGGQSWRIVIADESAKLNLIRMSRQSSEEVARATMDQLFSGRIQAQPSDDLPLLGQQRVGRWEPWIEASRGEPMRSPRAIASVTQRMTLWGDGRLNVCRCEPETIAVLWRQLFGHAPPPALDEIRAQRPPPSMNELITALALRESQAETADRWLTTESRCFSVWVFCQSDRRVSSSVYVEWGHDTSAMERRGYEY